MAFEDKTDEELVKMTLRNGDDYLYLMQRYEKKLLRYIHNIANVVNEDAEDILQDIFIKAYRNLNGFDTELKFSSWIYRIAHNEVISHWRKVRVRPSVLSVEDNEELIKNLASDANLAEEADGQYLREAVRKILAGMDRKYREVLILKYLEFKDYREISDILKKPVGTVAIWLNRAKKHFLREAKKQGINLN